jgi:hypothetical protein
LPDEFDDQLGACEGDVGDAFDLENFVQEVGAALEGEFFREDEGVVAVEEDGVYLGGLLVRGQIGRWRGAGGTFDILAVLSG